MASLLPLIWKKSWIIQAIFSACKWSLIELCLLLWWLVSRNSLTRFSWVRLQSWHPESRSHPVVSPVKDAEKMRVNTFGILNFTNPILSGSGTLRRLRDFAFETDLPTSEVLSDEATGPSVNLIGFSLFGSSIIMFCPCSFCTFNW